MKVIPVIDLMGGRVVAAKNADRSRYSPLVSPLCESSQPAVVAAALLSLHPFDTLYIADLDAIDGRVSHQPEIESLHRLHPRVTLWVDSGLRDLELVSRFARPVLGTESLASTAQLASLMGSLPAPLLSLDYRDEVLLGPPEIAADPGLWPRDVIVMTLSRVGSHAGPDLALLEHLMNLSPQTCFYAAGGVRDAADLRRLRELETAGALVSSALHRGPTDILDLV